MDNQNHVTGTEGGSQQSEPSLEDILAGGTNDKEPKGTEPTNQQSGTNPEGKMADETQRPAWIDQLPEELKGNADKVKQFSKFKKIGDLANSYAELEAKIGSSIQLPGKDAKPEDVEKFYQKLGKPESADKYSFTDKDSAEFRKLAYANNLTEAQARAMYEAVKKTGIDFVKQQEDNQKQMVLDTSNALKEEYGNKYAEKMELLKRAVSNNQELGQIFRQAGILYSLPVVKHLITLGEMGSEANFSNNSSSGKSDKYVSTAEGGSFKFKDLP